MKVFLLLACATLQSATGDEAAAQEWLEQLESFSDTAGAAASLFENLNGPETSEVWSHSFALVGCISSLISGFLGTDPSDTYVQDIQKLQSQLDTAIGKISAEVSALIQDLEEDFIKIVLAPKATILSDAIEALTEFSSSSKTGVDLSVWQAQMDPIGDRIDAWNEVAGCFAGTVSTCGSDMLSLVLNDGQAFPRPAVLAQFVAYHYSLLASSATSICAYDTSMSANGCALDLTLLQTVSGQMSAAVTSMKSGFYSSLGENLIPSVIRHFVDQYANQGEDGAVAILNAVTPELDAFYFGNGMSDFFGLGKSYGLALNQGSGNWISSSWMTGWQYSYKGYDVQYMFNNDSPYSYATTDCRSGSEDDMADCIHSKHNAADWVLRAGRRRYNIFWAYATSDDGCGTEYTSVDVRIIVPGSCASSGVSSRLTNQSVRSGSFISDDEDENLGAHEQIEEIARKPRYRNRRHDGPLSNSVPIELGVSHKMFSKRNYALSADPESVLTDISNAFATAGAIADFFGPEGEVVGLVLDLIGSIFSFISGLLGLGQPDPVVEALRNLEKDVMSKLTAVEGQIATAQSVASLGSIRTILNNAEQPLKDIVSYWNTLYPYGSTDGALNSTAVAKFTKDVGSISKYRDTWNTLEQCLAGTNVDCVLGGKTALEILLQDGTTYDRPIMLTNAIKYYWLLLQKSSVAICAYSQLALGDDTCKLMPSLSDKLTGVSKAMQNTMANMKSAFMNSWSTAGMPPVIKFWVDQHANQELDGINAILPQLETEFDQYYFADGLGDSFGFGNSWGVALHGGTGNWAADAWVTGYWNNYNGYYVSYMFNNDVRYSYASTDCRSGSEDDMATCLYNMHGADDWVFRTGRRRFSVYWGFQGSGSSCGTEYNSGDARMIVPGSCPSSANGAITGAVNSTEIDSVTI
jgi:enamine deaminase RidA (YjgF/YER057c/UK114 family)